MPSHAECQRRCLARSEAEHCSKNTCALSLPSPNLEVVLANLSLTFMHSYAHCGIEYLRLRAN
eukprot:COSAG06_NODE_581_length_14007_cov_3.569056_8_plen_63_part_00